MPSELPVLLTALITSNYLSSPWTVTSLKSGTVSFSHSCVPHPLLNGEGSEAEGIYTYSSILEFLYTSIIYM